jgi:cell division protein FtsW
MENNRLLDNMFLFAVLILMGIGIVMVFSSSSLIALKRYDDGYYFLKKQALFAFIGIILLLRFMRLDYRFFRDKVYLILGISLVLLILVLIPGIGAVVGGARRWLRVFGFSFQPSELAKLALIIFFAYSMEKKEKNMKSFSIGFLPHVGVAGIFFSLILLEPDFGTAVMMVMLVFVLLFAGGVRTSYLIGTGSIAVVGFLSLILCVGYRLKRWTVFLDPWSDARGAGYHIIQSLLAFGSGGLWGMGLGNGRQKLFYLPEPHTDFILSVIGEELGLIGVFAILVLFFFLLNAGIMISLRARDQFGTYLGLGITSLIGIEAAVNMGVVMGLLPTKGSTLPFVSYGGTSLVVKLISVGIMLNIASHERRDL